MAILVPFRDTLNLALAIFLRTEVRLERIFIYKDGVWLMNGGMAAI